MDRREALKRLGVGGALAVTAPLLLDSFNVAHAMSPPSGLAMLVAPPVTAKANSIVIDFNEDMFGSDRGPLSFDWVVIHQTPPIAITLANNDSSMATLSKANGNGMMNSFTIEVTVWEEGVDDPIAVYHVVSDGGQLDVIRQSS